uniref:Uncharacterized protein LOC101512204 n=2 Tax=Cicer arietinum TaxID=3827 RepID=A0A3Q7YA07_CICAR|nr:uncharacterized protein LOC101512204 [Cicer arietinum]
MIKDDDDIVMNKEEEYDDLIMNKEVEDGDDCIMIKDDGDIIMNKEVCDLIMNKEEEDGDLIMNKEEEDGDQNIIEPELFAMQLKSVNEGCLIEEEDVPMISNDFYKYLLLENFYIK